MVRLVPRIRFSLRTFFLTLILLSLIGSNQYTSWKWRLAQKEIQRLRDELGYLTIDDPTRYYVREVPTMETLSWRWRVYVPPGDRQFCLASSGIAEKGTGAGTVYSSGKQRPRDPMEGEFTLTARVEPDRAGRWNLVASCAGRPMGISIPPPFEDWLASDTDFGLRTTRKTQAVVAGAKGKTESFAADEPVVLLRLRAPTPEQETNHQSCDGVMIWFDSPGTVPGKPNIRRNSATGTGASR